MATTITANGINFPDGSASAPSIGGTDTNTGLFTGSDIVGFATGGTERLRITSDGKIGVAETSPDHIFHIKGSTPILAVESSSWVSGVSAALRLSYTDGNAREIRGHYDHGLQFFLNPGEVLRIPTDGSISYRTGGGKGFTFNSSGSSAHLANVFCPASYTLAFGTNSSERLRIDSSGRVGIGTTSPSTKLSLEGSAGSISHGILIGAKNAGGIRGVIEVHTAADTTGFNLSRTGGGSDTDIVLLKNDGDIGVVECRNSSNTSKVRLKAGALSYLHSEDSRGHQELLELKHTNTTTTGDGPALLFNGYYSSAEWKYAKISSENSGSGFGAKFKIYVHPSNGSQGANLVQALDILGDGTGANVTVTDGNLKIGTSGHGIDFSATSNASGMSSELLDSYEEGTWTPTFSGYGGASGSFTYAGTTSGKYTRIGNQVTIWWYCAITNMATLPGGSYLTINSLPFTHTGGAPVGEGASAVINWWNPQGAGLPSGDNIVGFVQNNTTRIVFGQQSASNIGGFSPTSFFGSTTGSNSSYMYGMTTYIA